MEHVQYSAPTASASAPESDPDVDEGLGAPDVEVELERAVEDARSEDAVRVLESALFFARELERIEEVAGMPPSPVADDETADEVRAPLPELLVRV